MDLQKNLMKNQKRSLTIRNNNNYSEQFPLSVHLLELRIRILWSILAIAIGTAIGYYFNGAILEVLLRPLKGPLFYSSPAGGFDFTLQVSFFFGFLLALPLTLYHVIRFLEPALSQKSKYFIIKFLFFSLLLMVLGISFGYFVSLPAALHFLSSFGSAQVKSLISTDAYLSFVIRYLFGFGLLFELPLIMLIINSITKLHAKKLFSYQRYVILVSFILAAIITPTPDIINQTMMAVPLILLYEFSVFLVWYTNKKGSLKPI